jgi:hypothetical protein
LSVAALLALLSGAAHADAVPTGAPRERLREGAAPLPQMVFVEPRRGERSSPAQVTLIGITGELRAGEEYDVYDDGGFAARVRVLSVARTNDKCPGFVYQRGIARVGESHHDIDAGRAVAIGPTPWPRRAARLLPWNGGASEGVAPPPGLATTLIHFIDLDGDGAAELARYLYQCSGGPVVPWSGRGAACFEDWARGPRGWRSTARVEFTCD